jgi:monofunctional biosynthetic peptidoglycan transglycosylase
MKSRINKILIFYSLLTFIGGYILLVILSTPNIASIKGCPELALQQTKLCNTSPYYVSLNEVSAIALHAIIVAEDKGFYTHHGFDFGEILNSLKQNFRHFQFVRGGSTISQQVIKNFFLSRKKTINRKIQEAYLTMKLEQAQTKEQILEKYINLIELGPNLFGIKKAAGFYFHKNPADLTLLESAYLAHLLPNPRQYAKSFTTHKLNKFSRGKVLNICRQLWNLGYISATEYLSAEKLVDEFPWSTS